MGAGSLCLCAYHILCALQVHDPKPQSRTRVAAKQLKKTHTRQSERLLAKERAVAAGLQEVDRARPRPDPQDRGLVKGAGSGSSGGGSGGNGGSGGDGGGSGKAS